MLQNKTITGVLWNFTEQFSRRGLEIIITLLLARFLAPEAYGHMAMMVVFLALAGTIMNSGLREALIRKKLVKQIDYNTAFYSNLFLGILSYFLLFVSAPAIADFYEEPELVVLIRVAGLSILINAFQVVQIADLTRALNFRTQLLTTVPATIISGVSAVFLAYAGWGVWALIAQILLSAFFITMFLWWSNAWRPTWTYSRNSLREMMGFGSYLFLENIFSIISKNLYIVVIAKLFGSGIAGYYFFATKIKELVTIQLISSIQKVTYSALANYQDDNRALKSGYRKVIGVATFIIFPVLTIIAALAEPLFKTFLPDRWLPAVPYLQLVLLSGIFFPLNNINLNILLVKGRSDLVLFIGFLKKIMLIGILLVSYRYGIYGILIGQIIGSVLNYIPNSYYSTRLINYPIRQQVSDFMPNLTLSGIVALIIYGASFLLHWPAAAVLMALASCAGILYIAGAHVLRLPAYLLARELLAERINRR